MISPLCMLNHLAFTRTQLHQLIPSVLTCIVARTIGERNNDEHWELRDFSAKLVASMCTKYRSHKNLQVCF